MGEIRRPEDVPRGGVRTEIRLLDELAARATVSPMDRYFDGWHAKAAPDLPFRRCNAVLPPMSALDRGRETVSGIVDALETWYSGFGQRVIIQLSSADPHRTRLDEILAERGYEIEAPVHLMVRSLLEDTRDAESIAVRSSLVAEGHAGPLGPPPDVSVDDGIDEVWATRYAAAHGGDESARHRTESYGRMLAVLGTSAIGASAAIAGEPAGVGFGVLDEGWVGIFGMGTAVEHRHRGVARAIVGGLLERASARGATGAYLQVETDNQPAIDLYSGLGFGRSHGYHYRVSAPRR